MSPEDVPQASEALPSQGELHCAAVVGRCAAWLHLTGELDLATAPQLEQELDSALDRARMVVLDLRMLRFMDVAGLRVILGASDRAAAVGGRLVIIRAPGNVHRVFELAGVSERLVIFDASGSEGARVSGRQSVRATSSVRRQGDELASRPPVRSVASPEPEGPIVVRDDEALMRLIRDGREDAFEELYDRYSTRAYRVARSICDERRFAELAVHDAFVSVWRGEIARRARRGSVAAWLLMVVGDQAASVARREREYLDEAKKRPGKRSAGPEDRSEARVRGALLAGLPDAQRDVIVLACYGELALDEIADQLALTPAAVKNRMRMGLRGLRAQSEQPAT